MKALAFRKEYEMKVLLVVDMQNDFINGSLGTAEAQAIVPRVCHKISNFDGMIVATKDTHFNNYFETQEGKKLPIRHCIEDTNGWSFHPKIKELVRTLGVFVVEKNTFGSITLPYALDKVPRHCIESIELVGLCTDICVVSNALILKAKFPELKISVDASCCAGTTPKNHSAALTVMKSCQIEIINE